MRFLLVAVVALAMEARGFQVIVSNSLRSHTTSTTKNGMFANFMVLPSGSSGPPIALRPSFRSPSPFSLSARASAGEGGDAKANDDNDSKTESTGSSSSEKQTSTPPYFITEKVDEEGDADAGADAGAGVTSNTAADLDTEIDTTVAIDSSEITTDEESKLETGDDDDDDYDPTSSAPDESAGAFVLKPELSTGGVKPVESTESTSSTSSSSSDKKEVSKMESKIAGRKKRLKIGYQTTSYLYGIITIIIVAIARVPYFAAGAFLSACTAHILKGAAEHNRLSSDTYKRLNLALFTYAGLEAFHRKNAIPMLMVANVIAMIQAVKGYGYGLLGWDKSMKASAKKELLFGLKSTLKGMSPFGIPSTISAGYWAASVSMMYLTLDKLWDIIGLIVADGMGLGSALVTTRIHRLAKYTLLSAIVYTLKDASDRGRLEGATFIQLNFMASATFASMAAYQFATASGMTAMVGWSGFLSFFTAFVGYTSRQIKKSQHQ